MESKVSPWALLIVIAKTSPTGNSVCLNSIEFHADNIRKSNTWHEYAIANIHARNDLRFNDIILERPTDQACTVPLTVCSVEVA
jgi:hypothetical protein